MKSKNLFKKLSVLALVFIMIFALAACSNDTATDDDTPAATVVSLETVEDKEVDYGTTEEDVPLPAELEATLSDDSTVDLDVAWSSDDYTADVAGDYTFVGSVEYEGEVTKTDDVTVTVLEEPKTVALVSAINGIGVDYGTTVADIGLPGTVEVTLSDDSTADVAVSWDTSSYDPTVPGGYVFEGTLDLSGEDFTNPDSLTASVRVDVAQETPTEVTSVESLEDVVVDYNTSVADVEDELPNQVTATLANGNDVSNVPVSWITSNYVADQPGTYTLTGVLDVSGFDNIANPTGVEASIDVVVEDLAVVSVSSPEVEDVGYGTPFADIGLPGTVEVTLSDDSKEVVDVDWDENDYNGDSDVYVVEGVLENLPGYVINPEDMKASVTLSVTVDITDVDAVADLDVNNSADGGPAFEELALPEVIEVTLEDGNTVEVNVDWAEGDFDGSVSDSYALEGSLVDLPELVTNNDDMIAEALVEVREADEVNIIESIDNTIYTLNNDGSREFDLEFTKNSKGSVDSATVQVEYWQNGNNIEDGVRKENRTLSEGETTKIATMAPELSTGDYTVKVFVDYDGDTNYDYVSNEFSVYTGSVEAASEENKTFRSVNEALELCKTVTLFDDVAEDVVIESDDVVLNLNGFAVNSVSVEKDAVNPKIEGSGSNINGDLTVKLDGPVTLYGVTIGNQVVFDEAGPNSDVIGDFTILGDPKYRLSSIYVETAGELDNALMNQWEEIYFADDITQDSSYGNLKLDYDVELNLKAKTLELDGQDIDIIADATISAGMEGRILGLTGAETINVEDEAIATIKGKDGNIINIEDIAEVNVDGTSELTLLDVQFDEGVLDAVDFDVENILNIEETVTANDVDLTFVGGEAGYAWYSIGNGAPYGIVQGNGVINGTGKIVIDKAPDYHFRGNSNSELLTLDVIMEVNINSTSYNVNNSNVILSNLELNNQVRLNNKSNVVIDDLYNYTSRIVGGEFVGADGTDASEYRVAVNREYFSKKSGYTTNTYFEGNQMEQIAFNIANNTDFGHNQRVFINEHTFQDRVFVDYPSGETLTATGDVYVEGNTVEFGNGHFTSQGLFEGSTEVHGPGEVLFTANYAVSGTSKFTFSADMRVAEGVTVDFAELKLLNRVNLDGTTSGAAIDVSGDLLGEDDNYASGKIIGTDQNDVNITAEVALENINLQEVKFNVNYNTEYIKSAFDEDATAIIATDATLKVVDGLLVRGADAYVTGEGTFTGDRVHGPHPLNIDDASSLNVEGNSYFTFETGINLYSDVYMSLVEFNTIDYKEDDLTIYVLGNMKAWDDDGSVQGRFRAENQDGSLIQVDEKAEFINLTLEGIENLLVNEDTTIIDELGGTYYESDVGLYVRHDTAQETTFNIAYDTSLIVHNTTVRLRDNEQLNLIGLATTSDIEDRPFGAVRGTGTDGGRFYSGSGKVVLIDSNSPFMENYGHLMLHGDRDNPLEFDLVVEAEEGTLTEFGEVHFTDWVNVLGDATLRGVGHKVASYEKGIDITTGSALTIDTNYQERATISTANADDYVRHTTKGVSGNALIKGDGNLHLGELVKLENITLKWSLANVRTISTWYGDTDEVPLAIVFDDVVLEDNNIWFNGWELHLDGDVELVEVNSFPELNFETINNRLSKLHGYGNTVLGDGGLSFKPSTDLEVEAEDVTFDIRETGFPYEVQIVGDNNELAIFTDVDWTNQTTVNVEKKNTLRFEGHNVNDGGLRVWEENNNDVIGLEREWNLEYPNNYNTYQ